MLGLPLQRTACKPGQLRASAEAEVAMAGPCSTEPRERVRAARNEGEPLAAAARRFAVNLTHPVSTAAMWMQRRAA
jgi:hypothetical protein